MHNIDGLKQEISDINADIEQYRAMSTDSFYVNQDNDPYKDAPDPSIILPKGKVKPFSNTTVNFNPGHYSDSSQTESLAVHRADFITRLEQELFDKKNILAAINCVLYYLNGYDKKADREIIYYRYSEHLPWPVVAKKMYADKDNLRHREQHIIDDIITNYNVRLK